MAHLLLSVVKSHMDGWEAPVSGWEHSVDLIRYFAPYTLAIDT